MTLDNKSKYHLAKGFDCLLTGKLETAMGEMGRASNLSRCEFTNLCREGTALYYMGKYRDALTCYQKAFIRTDNSDLKLLIDMSMDNIRADLKLSEFPESGVEG